MFAFIFFIFQSQADLGCEKFDGAAYDECVLSGKHDAAKVKEEDVDKTEEGNCQRYRDAASMKSCLARAHESAVNRAKDREEKERAAEAAKAPPKKEEKPPECQAPKAMLACKEAHQTIQGFLDNPNVRMSEKEDAANQCAASCTRVTPSVGTLLNGCTMDERRKVYAVFAKLHPSCRVPSSASDICTNYASDDGQKELDVMAKGMAEGTYVGDKQTCTDTWCTSSKKLTEGVTMVADRPVGDNQGVARVYYTDSSGKQYSSFSEASSAGMSLGTPASSDLLGSAAPRTSVNAEALARSGGATTSGGSSTGGSQTREAAAVADTTGGNGTQVAATEKPSSNPAQTPQQNPGSTTGGNPTPAAATTGGAASPSSFSASPFAGTGFTGGTGIEGTLKSDPYQALADTSRSTSNFDSEVTGSGNGSDYGGGSGSGGGYSRGNSYRGMEAVGGSSSGGSNGGRSLGGGSSGGGSSGAASGGRVAIASNKGTGDSLASPFQSGYFKPSGSAIAGGKASVKAATHPKGKRVKRKGQVVDCGGNLTCIAGYLGKNKSKSFRGRGLASIGSLPRNTEIGSGYGDIMSTMERIHNKFEMDEEGNLEVPR